MTAEHLNPAWRTVNLLAEHFNLAWRTVNLPAEHLNLAWRTGNLFAEHLEVLIGHFRVILGSSLDACLTTLLALRQRSWAPRHRII
jgi:hypothetical protein